MLKTEEPELSKWKSRLEIAREHYGDERNEMKKYEDYYNGTRVMQRDANSSQTPTKLATNVRNIVYELIESQVDSSIPMPKVRAIHAEDDELAKKIEHLLENKIKTCKLTELNDIEERNVPIKGGDFTQVQWDVTKGLHCEVGDLRITEVAPEKLIPQPGMTELDDMDYFFVQELMTKKQVKRMYDKDVSDAANDGVDYQDITSQNPDIVTVNTAYYRNDESGVGIFVWCDDVVLLSMRDYEARQLERCAKCGTVMVHGTCPTCGSKKSVKKTEDYEELAEGIEIRSDFGGMKNTSDFEEDALDENGNPIQDPVLDENGLPIMGADGLPQMQIRRVKKKIPYYKPNVYPIVLRRNITRNKHLVGGSDVCGIIDQQDTIKKLGTKINEKLLKGGSYVTLPKGKKVETNDKELKIIRVDNQAEAALINTINVQPNIQYDIQYLEQNYSWAKQMLGITDAYQGRFNSSEVSGTARQYAINQAAGRLESKRTLKNSSYAKLYEIMFKFWLAYSDQTTEITSTDSEGHPAHDEIDRHDFLKVDKAGEFYWDDEFIFETDPTSTLMANREAMWNQTDLKLQSQAFGPLGDLQTLRTYWTLMKKSGYPNAGAVLDIVEQRIQEQNQMQEQIAQQQMAMPEQEGVPDDLSQMQGGSLMQ